MARPFCHVHNHTEYSLLDGANRIPDMVSRAKELGMEALAITDHGVMFGVMEFHMECVKQGIKPLIGMEAYVAPGGIGKKGKGEEKDSFHLLLLAKDIEGYRNLCKLATIAALQGYYYRPRIDHEVLRAHCKGLISTTTCLGSEVNQHLLKGEYDKAQYIAGMYKEMFGEGNYFVELQDHGLPEQQQTRDGLMQISRELSLPLICTNDSHYLCKTDAQPHDVLLCIQTGAQVADEKRFKFSTDEFFLKSPEEMEAIFAETPEALENTMSIAQMCDVQLGKQVANMPDPDLPEGETPRSFLRKYAMEQLSKIAPTAKEDTYLKRLQYELEVIEKTGFESYFLLVKEFADQARNSGIFYGVRGSAAGSLTSYCLGITDIDPVEYDLTFERFLNPERVSMPDIDMDFEDARRDEIIRYVSDKYGTDHVAQIVTFGTLGAKAAIKDCGRVQGYTPQETDKICKTIPNIPGMTLQRALKESAEFRQMVDTDPRVRDLVETAKTVEGIARNCGVHAAGVVISKEPLVDHIPLYRGNDGQPITAFEMGILEKIGLLKMDFLGLSNLTVLSKAMEHILGGHRNDVAASPENEGWDPNTGIQTIPLDDAKTYEMLGRGETVGVFQLESGGMTRCVKDLKPQSVRELAALVALYRPGPMDHIPRFVNTKFGRTQPEYLHELMVPILEETYGVIVYQDQVLKLVQALGGFSLGKADVLRRAMGKKDKKAMDSMQVEFIEGCAAKEVSKEVADKVWELLLPFAGYAFNKAHAVCYAMIAYQTAFLKANFPVEYMAALLAVYRDKEDRVVSCIEECRRMKIPVLSPDVNASGLDFTIEISETVRKGRTSQQGQIRFGLAAIKGVGEGVARALIEERAANGPFKHLFEFADRMKPHGMNRTGVEALVKAGALDSIDRNRKKLLDMVDASVAFADSANRNRLAGQDSLFGGNDSSAPSYPVLPEVDPLGRSDLLALEKEVMGIYVSDHPLRGYERALLAASSHACGAVAELDEGTHVKLAGVIASIRSAISKQSGKRWATLTIEDFSGQALVTAFPATFERLGSLLVKDTVVKMSGTVSHRERPGGGDKTVEVRLEDVSPMDQLSLESMVSNGPGTVVISVNRATKPQLRDLVSVLREHPGEYEVQLQVLPNDLHLPIYIPVSVEPNAKLKEAVRRTLGHARTEVYGQASEYEDGEEVALAG